MLNTYRQPSSGPSVLFYVLGALVIVGGIALAVGEFVGTILRVNEWLTRVTVPGTTDIELTEPGKYTIYYEHRSVVDEKPYSSSGGNPGALDYRLTNKATGAEVALSVPSSSENYSFGPRSGSAVLVFTIAEAGTYTFAAAYRDGQAGPEMVLAIGKGVLKRLFAAVLSLMAVAGGGVIVGVVIIVVTALKRGKAQRATWAPPPFPPVQGTRL
jgi:hypothetical protein